jgi:hypothetical protein
MPAFWQGAIALRFRDLISFEIEVTNRKKQSNSNHCVILLSQKSNKKVESQSAQQNQL